MLELLGKEGLPVYIGGSPIDLQKELQMVESQLLVREEAFRYALEKTDTSISGTKCEQNLKCSRLYNFLLGDQRSPAINSRANDAMKHTSKRSSRYLLHHLCFSLVCIPSRLAFCQLQLDHFDREIEP
jgi:hypothetical protein